MLNAKPFLFFYRNFHFINTILFPSNYKSLCCFFLHFKRVCRKYFFKCKFS